MSTGSWQQLIAAIVAAVVPVLVAFIEKWTSSAGAHSKGSSPPEVPVSSS